VDNGKRVLARDPDPREMKHSVFRSDFLAVVAAL
jgi:hypothetical protein